MIHCSELRVAKISRILFPFNFTTYIILIRHLVIVITIVAFIHLYPIKIEFD